MNNVHKILILSLFLFFTSSGTSRAAEDGNLAWMSLLLGKTSSSFTYETVISAGGLVWMDRNLGASRVAESLTDAEAYGDLYQWGRGTDGHEKRSNNDTTSTLSIDDSPDDANFITVNSEPNDWRASPNNELWQGKDGINNPCPSGFRLPTKPEFLTEIGSWASTNVLGAFASPTKFIAAGYREHSTGVVEDAGTIGRYWSNYVGMGDKTGYLHFGNSSYMSYQNLRADGYSVRCIKD